MAILRVERCGAGVRAHLVPGGFTIVVGRGRIAGADLAAALGADYLVLEDGAEIDFGWSEEGTENRARAREEGLVMARASRRIGRRAIPFLLDGAALKAHQALAAGLADGVVAAGSDPVEWIVSWFGKRSAVALASAASLIREGRGDAAERAEFARLFAAGEPQRGLGAFLEKRTPDFEPLTVEIL